MPHPVLPTALRAALHGQMIVAQATEILADHLGMDSGHGFIGLRAH